MWLALHRQQNGGPSKLGAALAAAAMAFVITLALTATASAKDTAPVPGPGPWELVRDDEGVRVRRRHVEGTSLMEFQGTAVIEAPLSRVLSVLDDAEGRTAWMSKCLSSSLVERIDDENQILWNLNAAPWPVENRDTVIRTQLRVDLLLGEVWIDFHDVVDARVPPLRGVVRMPFVRGHWRLRPVHGGDYTEVEYQVHANPGGILPEWATNLASKQLPYRTLLGLRQYAHERRYEDRERAIEARPDYRALIQHAARTTALRR